MVPPKRKYSGFSTTLLCTRNPTRISYFQASHTQQLIFQICV